MRRRDLLALLSGAAVLRPVAAGAQQQAVPLVGLLSSRAADDAPELLTAFHQGLREAGFVGIG